MKTNHELKKIGEKNSEFAKEEIKMRNKRYAKKRKKDTF